MNHSVAVLKLFATAFAEEFLAIRGGGTVQEATDSSPHLGSFNSATGVTLRQEAGDIRVVHRYHGHEWESGRSFLLIVRILDHIFSEIVVEESIDQDNAAGTNFNFILYSDLHAPELLTFTFSGQLSERDLRSINWFILSRQAIELRLMLPDRGVEPVLPLLQSGCSANLHYLDYCGESPSQGALYRRGLSENAQERGVSPTLITVGVISLPSTRWAEFLTGTPIAIDFKGAESFTGLVSEGKLRCYQSAPLGRFNYCACTSVD